jgi:hypothetical protein
MSITNTPHDHISTTTRNAIVTRAKGKAFVTHTPLPTSKNPRNVTVAHAKGKSRALSTVVDVIGALPHARAIRPPYQGAPLL